MDGPLRWVVAILVVAAIIALVAFARGDAASMASRRRPRPRTPSSRRADRVRTT